MAEGLLLFCYFPNTSQSANADSSPQGEPPQEGRWHGASRVGEVAAARCQNRAAAVLPQEIEADTTFPSIFISTESTHRPYAASMCFSTSTV